MVLSLLIPAMPLLSFLVLVCAGGSLRPRTAGVVGTLSLAVSAAAAAVVAAGYFSGPAPAAVTPYSFEWLRLNGALHIDMGVLLDPLSVMMTVVVTAVSLAVHVYSMGYMRGERGFVRYYAFLSLFTFSMLGLVVATNIFQMYIFWELVGVSSYLLIGFYYRNPAAAAASRKAFIVTRFADLGFLLGILILSYYTGTFDLGLLTADRGALAVGSMAGASFMGLSAATWAMTLIFVGGAGKSALFPLHIWLPDAMEGPTPVSALIHAATMVVAGVWLVARLFPVYFFAAPEVLRLAAWTGAFTALFAAVTACAQTDIKRVLAFSTISQIAYMMAAVGLSGYDGHGGSGYVASMFHLFTHAFFKALLFLGAGSVIHAVHTNDMRRMGSLRRRMPVTGAVFLVGCLAISGVPPLSGFFSKDEILAAALRGDPVIFAVLLAVGGLTAFYMFRLYFRVFHGRAAAYEHEPHESPPVMLVPMVALAVVSAVAGFIPFGRFVSADGAPFVIHIDPTVAVIGTLVALAGTGVAARLYLRDTGRAAAAARRFGWLYRAAGQRFYVDRVWNFVTGRVIFRGVSAPVARFDRRVVDGAVNGAARAAVRASAAIKGVQSGKVQSYAVIYMCGVIVVAACVLLF